MSTAVVHYRGWIITARIRKIDSKAGPAEYAAVAILENLTDSDDLVVAEREKNMRRVFWAKGTYPKESNARSAAVDAAKRGIDLLY